MPSIGIGCHELRIVDQENVWRVIHRIDHDAILILEVFSKKTPQTPKRVIDNCRRRLQQYDAV